MKGVEWKASAEEGMTRVGHLNLGAIAAGWVLDQGRQLLGRSTASITPHCSGKWARSPRSAEQYGRG